MRLERVAEIPKGLELSPWSRAEWDRAPVELRKMLEERSSIWTSRGVSGHQIAVAGIIHSKTPGIPPELWLLLTIHFRQHLRSNLATLRDQAKFFFTAFPRLRVRVDAECPLGEKFTEYLGFVERRRVTSANGRQYIVFEVPN